MAIAYFCLAQISLSVTIIDGSAAAVWLPSGFALAAVLLLGNYLWPGIFIGAFCADILNRPLTLVNFTAYAIACTGNVLGILAPAYLIRRYIGDRYPFDRVRGVFLFALIAAVFGSVLDATIGTTALSITGKTPWSEYGIIWWTWWTANAVGIVIFPPLILAWIRAFQESEPLPKQRSLEAASLLFLTLTTCQIAFGKGYPVEYLFLPLLVWAAFRFGQSGATLSIAITSVIAIVATARDFGPFVRHSTHESLLLLQSFVGVVALTTLILSAVISENQQANAQLKMANADLQRLDRLKDEFLANTSHELRTPLNGIIGIAESLIDGATGQLPPLTLYNLSMLVSSARRLSNLVNDILDFSKLRHNTIELQLNPVRMRELVEVVLAISRPLIGSKQLQIVNAISPELPAVQADENRVQQILYNLIGNAIKFTDKGTVEISAEVFIGHGASGIGHRENNQSHEFNARSPLSTQHHAIGTPHLAITVSDTGIGIPADKLDRIFESFEQGDGSTAREYGGTGLGLAITKQLVELHGGNITVTSTVGVGSRLTFTLPLAGDTPETLPASSSTSRQLLIVRRESAAISPAVREAAIVPSESQSFKVLIVDDEPINLQVLVNHLSLQNYTVFQASNGIEALEQIEKGLKPDIILLDVMMPRMTGYEVTQKIRQRFSATELPILLLTAKNQVSDLVEGLSVGANDYLAKPIAKDELLARLKTHLELCYIRAENTRIRAELEVARKLQKMLLPDESELTSMCGLDIAGFMEPADEVGGDYYDVLQHEGKVKIGIGDVTGHGLESGVLTIMAQTAARALQEANETDPVKFLNAVNRTIYSNVRRMNSEKNMSLLLLDYEDSTLRMSGQHEETIVVRSDGSVERFDTIDLGFPIGLEEDIANFVSFTEVSLHPGDVVVLYTDGITEAENVEGVLYGVDRLIEVTRRNWQRSAAEIKQALIEDVRRHIGEQKVYDDITLVVLKQK